MKSFFSFQVTAKDPHCHARTGLVKTMRGDFETPVFMPVATQGTVKSVLPRDLEASGAGIILSNAYHLYIRPGMEIIREHQGLHRFMNWKGPILTDSGGFQVFSLSKIRKITEEGARFQSHFDGKEIFLTPENVLDIQETLGSDIAMIFDECPPPDYNQEQMRESVELTLRWSRRAKKYHKAPNQALFGIIQGGTYEDLRLYSMEKTCEIDFDGYAMGGLCVGESREETFRLYERIVPKMPADKPRYLMGIGTPMDFIHAVEQGADMFDCVTPTRYGRVGTAFTSQGFVVVRNGKYKSDMRPLMDGCLCYTCQNFTRSYLRHLFNAEEMLGPELVSLHNVNFFIHFFKAMRQKIREGTYLQFKKDFLTSFDPHSR